MAVIDQTETLVCFAGHEWTRAKRGQRGSPPKACPDHQKFVTYEVPVRSRVPKRLEQLWKVGAVGETERQYVKRWTKEWNDAVRKVAARRNSFADVPMVLIEAYIENLRVAEMHRYFANSNPYQEMPSGQVRQHPGWEHARQATRDAMSVSLLLFQSAGTDTAQEADEEEESPLPAQDYLDDQIGPDGRPL